MKIIISINKNINLSTPNCEIFEIFLFGTLELLPVEVIFSVEIGDLCVLLTKTRCLWFLLFQYLFNLLAIKGDTEK